MPDLVKARKAAQTFRELLEEQAKSHLEADSQAWQQTAKGVKLAQDLLKAEGGDPKVVLAAVMLHRVPAARAREFLASLETEPEMVAAIMALQGGAGEAGDLNRQLFQDVLALLQEPIRSFQFATRTAQRLAQERR